MAGKNQLSRPPLARMLRIHESLQGQRRANCRVLAAELAVSPRTVQRDIDFMRDQLGLPIEYDVRAHGFHYTHEVLQFPTMMISEGELVALSVARKSLSQYRGTPYEKPLRDAFEKLTAGLSEKIQFTWNDGLDNSISFRTAGQSLGDLETFDAASQGVLRCEEVVFGYRKLGSDREEKRHIQPLHLACIDQQWYLFGRDLDRAERIRTFALTRISGLRGTGRRFERPEDFSLDTHLADSFGVFSSPEAEEVRLRFDAFSARLIREREWHGSQRIEPQEDGSVILTLHVGVSPEVERWILGWGAHAEVLAPPGLRASIGQTAEKLTARYAEATGKMAGIKA